MLTFNLTDFMWDEDGCDFFVEGTDTLIERADDIRAAAGYTDLVRNKDIDGNEVCYKFYAYYTKGGNNVAVYFCAANSVLDNFRIYNIELTDKEYLNLLDCMFKELHKEYVKLVMKNEE